MNVIGITAEQAQTIGRWSCAGTGFVPLLIYTKCPTYAVGWAEGDVLVTQGDAHLHLSSVGTVKGEVPPTWFGAADPCALKPPDNS